MPNCYAKLCKVMFLTLNFCMVLPSLPSRGAWIEIGRLHDVLNQVASLPSRGAWIEMELMASVTPNEDVAPLTGGVD